MIAEPRKTGLIGEMRASRYLRAKGYEIYSANYRSKSGEIDLIAEKDGVLCFIEVKTRRESAYFTPAEAVDRRKEENVKSTAASFLAATKLNMPFRFDIIEVVLGETEYKIRHIENAF